MRASGQNVWWWVRRSREVQRASRSAYTLMEMLLVLAVLVIVAAITIPVIRSMMTDTRIDAAGDQVQSLAADTRARAMEDGRAWKLAYIPNSGFIQLAPEESDEWVAATTEVLEKKDLRREQLPLEIIFAATHDGIMGVQQAGQPGSTW
jgi:prepilin-type N-terminal cleavage/methylation domain-containing protein